MIWGSYAPNLVKIGSLPQREAEIWGSNPQPKHAIAFDLRKRCFVIHQVAASISDSAFHQITLVLLLISRVLLYCAIGVYQLFLLN